MFYEKSCDCESPCGWTSLRNCIGDCTECSYGGDLAEPYEED